MKFQWKKYQILRLLFEVRFCGMMYIGDTRAELWFRCKRWYILQSLCIVNSSFLHPEDSHMRGRKMCETTRQYNYIIQPNSFFRLLIILVYFTLILYSH